MRKLLPVLVATCAAGTLFAVACGEAPAVETPIPDEAYNLDGAGGAAGCTYFPDSCPAGQQCYQDRANAAATLCSDPGGKALGEDCDNTAGTKAQYCGPELACVQYGAAPNLVNRCTQLCNVDADCNAGAGGAGGGGAGGAPATVACTPLSGPDALKICPLP